MAARRFGSRKKRPFQKGPRKGFPAGHALKRSRERTDSGLVSGDDLAGDVLAALHEKGRPMEAEEIAANLGVSRGKRKFFNGLLADLCQRQLINSRDSSYSLAKSTRMIEGIIKTHRQGYAFVLPDEKHAKNVEMDVFIPPGSLASAVYGDRVLVHVIDIRHRRPEGRILKVLKRAAEKIVGVYTAGRSTGLVTPEDERFLFNIIVHREHSCGARNGEMVVAEITSFTKDQRNPVGRILQVLGDPDDLQVQADITIIKRGLPHIFDHDVLDQVEAMEAAVGPEEGRIDLRDIVHVTIDGEDARDFDDAVSVEKQGDGFRLYVSIADVSNYVTTGSPVDREAYRRGTSVYFPNRVIPMLPERLSNNLCSLVPGEDRYTFTAVMDFDRSGRRVKKEFFRSIITSRHRMTYTAVSKILVDADPETIAQYADVKSMLSLMGELEKLLEERRMARGSIGFELPEAKIVFDEAGKVSEISRRERNLAHKVIEEFMLAANEAVAETLAGKGVETLYRIHEEPDPNKVNEFAEFAGTLGMRLPTARGTSSWFGRVLKLVAGAPQEYIVNNLLLRTMKQARYSPENAGHFGLAATHYCHFTSPIRRYPDLVVHRVLAELLAGKKGSAIAGESMDEAGDFLSKRERGAMEAEREMVERVSVRFMADKVGEEFDAIVAGATSFGLFVELLDVFVSGAVPVEELRDDYYSFDEKRHRLIGSHTNRIFQIGDLIRVRLTGVVKSRRHINFTLAV